MAEKKASTLSVKLHMDVIKAARTVASLRGVTMTDLLSDMLREDLKRFEKEEVAKRAKELKLTR